MKQKPFRCGSCSKRFSSVDGAQMHGLVVHGYKVHVIKAPSPQIQRAMNREASMAELFIEGQMNRQAGIRNDHWLEDMLP